MFTHIFAAIDASERSSDVLGAVAKLAGLTGASVEVLHIDPTTVVYETSTDTETEAEAQAVVDDAVRTLAEAGVTASGSFTHAVDIDVARKIVDAAGKAGADLIVLAPHHRRGLDALFNASVSGAVAKLESKIPVLLVP